jgi:hypothetical protein
MIKNLVLPNYLEINILKHVIVSCENTTCEREFNINSLNEMIVHQQTCGKIVPLRENKLIQCKRCETYYSNDKIHDPIKEMKKCVNNNQTKIHQLKTYFEEKIKVKLF